MHWLSNNEGSSFSPHVKHPAPSCCCLRAQVTRILKVGNESTKLKATDVLLSIIQHDTPTLRSFLLKQQGHMMFALLVSGCCVLVGVCTC